MGQRAVIAGRSASDVPDSAGAVGSARDGAAGACGSGACGSGLRRALSSKESKATNQPSASVAPTLSSKRRVSFPDVAPQRVSPRLQDHAVARGPTNIARRASRHKARLERLLLSARSELGAALEMEGLPAEAREKLEAVDRKLREAEVEQTEQKEAFVGLKVSTQWKRLLNHCEQVQKESPVCDATRSWLLQNYSHHDLDAVGSSRLLDSGRRSLQGAPSDPSQSPARRPSKISWGASARWSLNSNSEDSPISQNNPWKHLMAFNRDTSRISSSARSSFNSFGSEGSEDQVCQRPTNFRRVSAVIQSNQVRSMLEKAGSLGFDAIAYAEHPEVVRLPLEVLGVELLEGGGILEELSKQGVIEESGLFRSRLFRFLEDIGGLYKKESLYHGRSHAADVTSTAEWFVRMPFVQERTTVLDHVMLLVAAAIHDVGHPGTNPLFHVKTMSSLAIRYNDKSVLENYHISLAFETMLKPDGACNWFALLPKDFEQHDGGPTANVQQYMRRGLVDMVLATDMSGHAKHVNHLRELGADPAEWPTVAAPGQEQEFLERKLFLLETLLHAADLSNPCRPQSIMLRWTKVLLSEFWAQGDEEIRLGLPVSPLCDRQAGMTTVPKGQLGFVQFVIEPFFSQIATLMPEAREATDHLSENKAFWEVKDREHATYEDIFLDQ